MASSKLVDDYNPFDSDDDDSGGGGARSGTKARPLANSSGTVVAPVATTTTPTVAVNVPRSTTIVPPPPPTSFSSAAVSPTNVEVRVPASALGTADPYVVTQRATPANSAGMGAPPAPQPGVSSLYTHPVSSAVPPQAAAPLVGGGLQPAAAPQPPLTQAQLQLQQQAAALAAREAELAKKEAQMQAKEEQMTPPKPNWPGAWCPLIVHDIARFVPQHKQEMVKQAYLNWLALFFSLPADIIIVLISWVGTNVERGDERFGLSFAYWIFDAGAVWFLCYHMLYATAVRKKRSWKFGYFGVTYGIQIGFLLFLVIGVQQSGAAGLVGAIQFFVADSAFVGVLYIVAFAKNACLLVHSVLVWIKVRKFHKQTQTEHADLPDDNPFDKAKKIAQVAQLAGALYASGAGQSGGGSK